MSGTGPRSNDDVARVHPVRLPDHMHNGRGDRLGLQGDLAITLHDLRRHRIGDRVGQLGFHHTRIDAGDAELIVLLAQPVRDRTNCIFGGAINGGRRRDGKAACQSAWNVDPPSEGSIFHAETQTMSCEYRILGGVIFLV